ncbi:metallophosphoesterase [Blastococcus brunescens]|uniref:Metallophosphoesterase n=1 Tax=Blastococcus brunescens TaxID=1564165 RepID=A0ABZ1B0X4_9ACTN|nr:metallophosphoesterase [Blastococcus sp. BMG 8361]WRL64462.1 metallophosphoesterase [Blastococcus sp. BMG 8361]
MRWYTALPAAAASGASAVAYASLYERTRWTLRRFEVPVLAPGSTPLAVLQISDLHMTAGQRSKQDWVAGLAALEPDLVINTGDNLAGHDAVPGTLRALDPLMDRPGAFVLASNDYYAPRPKNPLKYFWPDHKRVHGDELPWRDLRDGMRDRGWLDLTNAAGELTVGGRRITLAGVDDSHLRRDRYDDVAGPADPTADVRIGLAHSPSPACSTGSPPTATTCSSAATRTAVSCGCRSTAPWSPTAASTVTACAGCTAGPSRPPPIPRAPGCTSRPVWAPARMRRHGSPAPGGDPAHPDPRGS